MIPKPYRYLIHHKPSGRLYHGGRARNVGLGLTAVQDTGYWGSSTDSLFSRAEIETHVADYEKIIIKEYDTEEEMWLEEQQFNETIIDNPLYANKMVVTNAGMKSGCGEKNGMFGKKHSPETRKKQAVKRRLRVTKQSTREKNAAVTKARLADPAEREKLRQNRLGYKHPEEVKAKIGAAHRGRKLSIEHREKIKQSHASRRAAGYVAPHKGRPFSEEHKAALKEAWKTRRKTMNNKQKKAISKTLKEAYKDGSKVHWRTKQKTRTMTKPLSQ